MTSKSLKVRQSLASELGVPGSDIAVREPRDLMAQEVPNFALDPEDMVDGVDALGREDMQIPHLILVQAQHSDIPENLKHVGQWFNDLTGEFAPEVTAIVLSLIKGRIAFPRAFSRESKALCASDDGLFPRQDFVGTAINDEDRGINWTIDGSACAQCPFAEFGPDGETPLCAKAYSYAMIDADTGMPFVVRAQRTGVSAAKQLNTLVRLLGRKRLIRLMSKEVKSDTGAYFVPVFSAADQTPEGLASYARNLSSEFGNIVARAPSSGTSNGHANGHGNSDTVPEPPPF